MKILLVDDHSLFRSGMQFILEELAQDVTFIEAESCEEALAYQHETDIDLVLLDYHLKGENSDDMALICIREAFSGVKIVVLSSEEKQSIILSAIEGGASGFIPKSSTPEVLIAALKLVFAGGIYIPEQMTRATQSAAINSHNSANSDLGYLSALSSRQKEVLMCAVWGKPNKIIARELDIAEGTVKVHLSTAYKILGVKNRTEAVFKVAKLGGKFS
jgi:DNA-binding NarL/FixJ family response regulator